MGGRKPYVFWMTRLFAGAFLPLAFRLSRQGTENLPRKEGFLLLSKHQRWEDIPLLSIATPRPLYYIAKYELFNNPLSHWFISSLGGIPLNRQQPLKSRRSLTSVVELLRQGEGIAVFPEGTYYRDKMGPGQVGIVRLILSRASSPFIPVGIQYRHGAWRTSVHIQFGKALCPGGAASPRVILNQIMGEIARLSGL